MEELHYAGVEMFILREPVALICPVVSVIEQQTVEIAYRVPCQDFRVSAFTPIFDIVKLEPALVLGTLLRLIK